MFNSTKRVINSGWKSFLRNKSFSVAVVFILVFVLILIPCLFVFQGMTRFLTSSVQEKADISVYFVQESLPKDILFIQEKLEELPEVKSVIYLSKQEVMEKFVEKHKNDEKIMQGLEEYGNNPFFACLNIKAFQASQYESIMGFLEASFINDYIDHTSYSESRTVIEKIFSITSFVNNTGIFLAILFSLIAVLVCFSQIRLAIVNSKEEIKLMRLIGASNWFIRGPFIAQAIIAGIFSAFIAMFVFTLSCFFLSSTIEVFIGDFNVFEYFINNFALIFSIQFIVGVSLSSLSSIFAIRKYLKA